MELELFGNNRWQVVGDLFEDLNKFITVSSVEVRATSDLRNLLHATNVRSVSESNGVDCDVVLTNDIKRYRLG